MITSLCSAAAAGYILITATSAHGPLVYDLLTVVYLMIVVIGSALWVRAAG